MNWQIGMSAYITRHYQEGVAHDVRVVIAEVQATQIQIRFISLGVPLLMWVPVAELRTEMAQRRRYRRLRTRKNRRWRRQETLFSLLSQI